MTTVDFVGLWAEGDNSFEEAPPNAVLAFLEPGDGSTRRRGRCDPATAS